MTLFAVATQEFVDKHNIKTFADIKARKIPMRVSVHRIETVTVNGQVNELLKAYGITEADIKSWGGEVHHEATAGYTKLMENRRLDVAFSTGWHPSKDVTELEAGTKLTFIPFDKPQVDQVIKTFGLEPAVIKAGTYDCLKEDYITTDLSFPILARDDASDHLVYGLTKSLYNQFGYFKTVHPLFAVAGHHAAEVGQPADPPVGPAALQGSRPGEIGTRLSLPFAGRVRVRGWPSRGPRPLSRRGRRRTRPPAETASGPNRPGAKREAWPLCFG